MATAFADAGAGVLTATSGAACSPLAPAVVNADDVLIVHAFYGGNTTAPSTPSGTTLLSGPHDLSTPATNGRVWVYGKIADGTEDGAAFALGSQAVTTPRRGRVYRFTGALSDTILNVVLGFAFATGTTAAVSDTGVTTVGDNSLACQLVAVADDNAMGDFTGETGGDWTEATAEFTGATGTPDTCMQLQTASIASAGTINGGAFTMGAADPWGVVGFYIKSAAAVGVTVTPGVIAVTTSLPQASAGVGVAPAAVAAVAAVPQANAGVGATPAAFNNVVALPQAVGVEVQPDVTVTPNSIAAVAALPQAAIGVGAAPPPVGTAVALPQAAVGVGVVPAAIAALASLPQAAISVGAAPSVLSVSSALPQAAVGVGVALGVVPVIVALPLATPDGGAAGAATVTPAVIAVVVTLPTATIIGVIVANAFSSQYAQHLGAVSTRSILLPGGIT